MLAVQKRKNSTCISSGERGGRKRARQFSASSRASTSGGQLSAARGSCAQEESVWIFGLINNIEQLLSNFGGSHLAGSPSSSGSSGSSTPSSGHSSAASSPHAASACAGQIGPPAARQPVSPPSPLAVSAPGRSSLSRQIKFHEYKGPPSVRRAQQRQQAGAARQPAAKPAPVAASGAACFRRPSQCARPASSSSSVCAATGAAAPVIAPAPPTATATIGAPSSSQPVQQQPLPQRRQQRHEPQQRPQQRAAKPRSDARAELCAAQAQQEAAKASCMTSGRRGASSQPPAHSQALRVGPSQVINQPRAWAQSDLVERVDTCLADDLGLLARREEFADAFGPTSGAEPALDAEQIEPSIDFGSCGADELLFSEFIDLQDVPMNVSESDWLKKFLPPV